MLVHHAAAFARDELFAPPPELRDGIRDRIVEAPVECTELDCGDGGVLLDGHIGHGLAEIPVIMNDLADAEPVCEQFITVSGRRPTYVGGGCGRRNHRLL